MRNELIKKNINLCTYLHPEKYQKEATGRVKIAQEVMKAVRSIETAMMFDAYDAFATATGNLSGNLAVANYSENSLISLCEKVTAYNQGIKAVIIGTPVALKAILPTNANYRYLLDDEYVRLGHLQTFNGKIYLGKVA